MRNIDQYQIDELSNVQMQNITGGNFFYDLGAAIKRALCAFGNDGHDGIGGPYGSF